MGYSVKQSQTARPLLFKLRLASDHITGATGKSPTVTLSKNGAAFGSPAGAVTEVANGWYKVAGNATDAGTLGPLVLHATAALCDETDEAFEVVAYDPDDGSIGLLDLTAGVETNRTLRQAFRLMLASLAGKLSGAAGTTVTIRDTNDTKDRVVATVDSSGNRSAVTLDAS